MYLKDFSGTGDPLTMSLHLNAFLTVSENNLQTIFYKSAISFAKDPNLPIALIVFFKRNLIDTN